MGVIPRLDGYRLSCRSRRCAPTIRLAVRAREDKRVAHARAPFNAGVSLSLPGLAQRGEVCAYPLGPRLSDVQPGADGAHRRHTPGRKLDRECL
jgi:hypothetical protein